MILHELECRFLTIAFCDAAEPWQLGFQDAATPIMQGIIDLHHDIFFFLILILVFVLWMLVRALWINKMRRSRGNLSGNARITAGASSSSAAGGEDKEREKLRKKCKRSGVHWAKAFFHKYGIEDPNVLEPECFDWPEVSDDILQNTFQYHEADSAGLRALDTYIKSQCGENGVWPQTAAEHDLFPALEKNLGPNLKLLLRPPGSGSP